jgi:putative phosphoesterase
VRIGVISDLHGNIHALRAVIAEFATRGVRDVICLGDLVGYGASPAEVIDWLRQHEVPTTLGASDARVAFEFADPLEPRQGVADATLAWTKTVLSREDLAFLRGLNLSTRLQTPAGRLKFFHGQPDDPDGRLDLRAPEGELDGLLESMHCQVVLCGGTHVPYVRRVQRGLFVNPGSVGLSLNGEPGADCAILDLAGPEPRVELLKVPYDFHAAAFDVLTWDLPDVVATVLKTGRAPA